MEKEVINQVTIEGCIKEEFSFSHMHMGEKYYRTKIAVARTSGAEDTIPVIVSENVVDIKKDYAGQRAKVIGQYRSHDDFSSGKMRLLLYVFAKTFSICGEGEDINNILLEGFVCKAPLYRKTPFGRNITDLFLAVDREEETDYIPCICWEKEALNASFLSVGTKVSIKGRVQSRAYHKKMSDGSVVEKVAYEVSTFRLQHIKDAVSVSHR